MLKKVYGSVKKELKRQASGTSKDSKRRNDWITTQIKYGVSGFKSTVKGVIRKKK